MLSVLAQMGLMIFCGWLWRQFRPGGMEADLTRQALAAVVYYLFLPALILRLMSGADIGTETARISAFGIAITLFGALITAFWIRIKKIPSPQAGAIWLAVTFPNVTFLGLPLLQQVFGDWAALLAIQLDLFACTPMVMTLGIQVARKFGNSGKEDAFWPGLLKIPPLWAAFVAIGLNVMDWQWPEWALAFLGMLSQGVTPLMLLCLGLALDWRTFRRPMVPYVLPVSVFKLLLMPWYGWWLSGLLAFAGDESTALVLEAGMPSMLFGIVLCDRFQLDSRLYALLVTVTTLLSMLTLSLWFDFLPGRS